jgi:hypothetical protein
MSKAVKFDAAGVQTIVAAIGKPIKNTTQFFTDLGAMIDRDTQLTFRFSGARSGEPKWLTYNWGQGVGYKGSRTFPSSTRYQSGKYKKRPGTDGSARRRYNANSKLLRASGLFQKSFKVTRVSNGFLRYESDHELAGKIGSRPERQVLFVTGKDKILYGRLFKKFVKEGIRV